MAQTDQPVLPAGSRRAARVWDGGPMPDATPTPAREDNGAAALYRAVGLDAPGYHRSDVARLAGVPHDRSVKWWRAMGFPEVPEDDPAFCEVDVEIARRLAALTGAGLVGDESILRLARVLGGSFSRLAEAQVVVIEELLDALAAAGLAGAEDRGDALLAAFDDSTRQLLEDSVVYVWRRHLLAALGRRARTDAAATERAVGFADLCGFTRLSQELPAERLARLVDAFERAAFDVVAARGGRVVKLIGDAVMFVADSLPVAVDIGLDLAARLRTVDDMPEVHGGIAFGPTIALGGDVFGPAANLAARLTSIARRGTIVVPARLRRGARRA